MYIVISALSAGFITALAASCFWARRAGKLQAALDRAMNVETENWRLRMELNRLKVTVRNYDHAWQMRPGQRPPIDDSAREFGYPRMMTVCAYDLEREVEARQKTKEEFNGIASGAD